MRQYSRVQQERLGIVTGRGVLLHGRDSEHLQRTFNRAQVLVEIRLYVKKIYLKREYSNIFVASFTVVVYRFKIFLVSLSALNFCYCLVVKFFFY